MASNRTLREKIVEGLREAILLGELQAGEKLQEEEVAKTYLASRTPVREAFRQLESEGFLVIRARRGAYIKPITAQDIREFYELKAVLEGYAAQKATDRLTDAEIDRMSELNAQLRVSYERGDIDQMIPVHNEFHEVFVHAAGNERLSLLVKGLVNQFQRFRITLSHMPAIQASIELHDEIIAAFRERDALRAGALVAQNSAQGSEALLSALTRTVNE